MVDYVLLMHNILKSFVNLSIVSLLRVNKNLATGVSPGFFFASKIALADLFRESSRNLMDSTFNWAFPETKLFLGMNVYSFVSR